MSGLPPDAGAGFPGEHLSGECRFSMFRTLADTSPQTVTLADLRLFLREGRCAELVGRIRAEPDKARRSALKRELPCVTISGEFAGGHKAEHLVRHNVSELRVMQLTERFELVRFVGRTLLSGKDVPGDFLNSKPAHVIKALVGGDTLEGEAKHGNESFAVPGLFNVMISTNTRLRVKLDSDAGAWRRRMLIVDYVRAKVARPVPGFDALLLREEGEGILRWAVEGAVMLMRELRDFGVIQLTEAQRRRVDDLLSESDSVRSFVRECVAACHRGEVATQDLAAAYRDYCEARDWEPLRERQFQSELPDAMLEFHRAGRRNDIRSGGKAVRGFRGVRLQPYGGGAGGGSPDASDGLREVDASETDLFDGASPGESGFSDGSDGLSKVNAYEKEYSDVITSEQPSEASEPEEVPF